MLGEILDVRAGRSRAGRGARGRRPCATCRSPRWSTTRMGLQAYMQHRRAAPAAARGRDGVGRGASRVDPAARRSLLRAGKAMPAVAGVALRDVTLQQLPRDDGREHEPVRSSFNVIFAGDHRRSAWSTTRRACRLSERSRELASLRVLGFTRAEISLILLGELAVLTPSRLPIGRGHRLRAGRAHHDRLQQRGVPAVVRRAAGHGRLGVAHRHCARP